jgi:integrase
VASKPYVERRSGQPTGRWVCKYKPDPNGKAVVVSLGKDPRLLAGRTPTKPTQAVLDRHRHFEEIEYNAKAGIRSAPARIEGLAGFVTEYLEEFARSHKSGSIRHARRHAASFLAFCEVRGVTAVQAVTQVVCRDYLASRILVVSHDTLRTEAGYLKPIWTRAVDAKLMDRNPWERLAIPGKSRRASPVFWTEEEVARIAAACAKQWQSDIVYLMAYSGLRISTALALKWTWVKWNEQIIDIPKSAAASVDGIKTAYPCAMAPRIQDMLARRLTAAMDEWVFSNPYRKGHQIHYDTARTAIDTAIARSGVTPGTPHDLRHTCARLMERSGAPLSIIQAQLGHSNVSTTQIYSDATATEAVKWLNRLGQRKIDDPPAL